jgi:uncharacterized membrane protein YeaQ/YmgE (transglycosylase-associated protein family)
LFVNVFELNIFSATKVSNLFSLSNISFKKKRSTPHFICLTPFFLQKNTPHALQKRSKTNETGTRYEFCTSHRDKLLKHDIMYWLWYLVIGLIAGWIANVIVRGGGAGFVINLIVGIIGGFLGGWLVGLWGWIAVGTFGTLLTSVAGAIILLLIVSLFTRRRPAND